MIIVLEPDKRFRASVVKQLASREVTETGDMRELSDMLSKFGNRISVVLVGPGIPQEEALAAAGRFQRQMPEVSMLIVGATISPDFLYAAIRAGVKDVLSDDFTPEQLVEAVDRGASIARSLRGRSMPSATTNGSKGHVVTVFSGKGGCGKSFVSTNLAVLLAQGTEKEVAIVDLDLQSGDDSIMLQLTPQWSLLDAAAKYESLDAEELRGYMVQHETGVWLLAAPFEPQDAESITGDAVHAIIRILKESFDYVIVDGPSGFTDPLLAAIDESDECVLMTSMDVPSIKNLKMALRTVAQLGIDRDRLRLVLNRADSKVGLHMREVEESIETSIDVALPSSRDVPLSINHGVPLTIHNRKSRVMASLVKLANLVRNSPSAVTRALAIEEMAKR